MAFNDKKNYEILKNYIQQRITATEAKKAQANNDLLYTSLSPSSTHKEVKEWLNTGVDMFLENKIKEDHFLRGIEASLRIVGERTTTEALKDICLEEKNTDRANRLYTIIRKVTTRYQYNFGYSYNIYDDNPEKCYIIPSESSNTLESSDESDESLGDDMLGTDYIHSEKRTFKHMKLMLDKLWDVRHTMPSNRFDAYTKFEYKEANIANHINDFYMQHEINDAHRAVIEDYRQGKNTRGRPRGAKNKNKVIPQSTENTFKAKSDPILDGLPTSEDDATTIDDSSSSSKMLDASKFVTYDNLTTILYDYPRAAEVTHNFTLIKSWGNEVDAKLLALENRQATVISLEKAPELPKIDLGIQHKSFPLLVNTVRSILRNGTRVIPWVYGPAGTGKTYACEQLERVFDLPVYVKGKTLGAHEVMGFINTTGYQTTAFRRAYEFGGIFVADELDSWSNDASTALLSPVGNTRCEFPDGSVKRHPNFIMVCCANTTGSGATMDYVGRTKQDGAVMNRFVHLHWPLDEALEDSMCANKDWLTYVRHVRARVSKSSLNPKPLITPRASIFGETLLNTGIERQTVIAMTLRQGLSDQQWALIR